MKKMLYVFSGAAVLGACLLMATPVVAKNHPSAQPPIPPMPGMGAGVVAMDPNCVAKNDMAILNCGNKKKCKAKYEKMKKKCPRVHQPPMPQAILPYYPVPGQAGVVPPGHMGMMRGGRILEGFTPQATGKSPAIKTLPENVVKPFWAD